MRGEHGGGGDLLICYRPTATLVCVSNFVFGCAFFYRYVLLCNPSQFSFETPLIMYLQFVVVICIHAHSGTDATE
jgi:hypothetical protein